MFEQDMEIVKKLMEKHRRTSRYVKTFANIIYSIPILQLKDKVTNINDALKQKFPKLAQMNQLYKFEKSFKGIEDTTLKQEEHMGDIRDEEEERQKFNRNLQIQKNIPLLDQNQQIQIICKAFHQIGSDVDQQRFFQHIFENYQRMGGQKSQQQLKDKIVSDILFLAKYKSRNINNP